MREIFIVCGEMRKAYLHSGVTEHRYIGLLSTYVCAVKKYSTLCNGLGTFPVIRKGGIKIKVDTTAEDDMILRLFQLRSEQALLALNAKYGTYCYAIAYGILKSPDDTEECLNDILFHCWCTIPQSPPNNLKAYLGAISRNKAIDYYRKRHTARRGGEYVNLSWSETSSAGMDPDADQCTAMAIAQCLEETLAARPEIDRQLFFRRYCYGESIAELAQHLGLSQSCVAIRLMRLKNCLKLQLQSNGIYVS